MDNLLTRIQQIDLDQKSIDQIVYENLPDRKTDMQHLAAAICDSGRADGAALRHDVEMAEALDREAEAELGRIGGCL